MVEPQQTVLITGASTGIGKAAAILFHAGGWNVAASMRSPEQAAWANGDRLRAIRLDVTDRRSIRKGIAETVEAFGGIDVVVNNAGYAVVGPFEATEPEQIERQLATNVVGLMDVVREVIPVFRQRRHGTFVNVASMGGRITFPLYSVYHATKWAVEGFSESLNFELNPFGIRVKIVEPGAIRTDFYDRSMDVVRKPELDFYDAFVSKVMGTIQKAGNAGASPESVAKVIFRSATDGSSRIRYSASSAGVLTLRRILPDRLFMKAIRIATKA